MPDLASDLRSYVDRLAELAEEHAAAAPAGDPSAARRGGSILGLRRLRPRPGASPAPVADGSQETVLDPLDPGGRARRRRPTRRVWAAASLAAALVVVVAAVVLADGGSDGGDDVRAADTTVPGESTTTTASTTTTTVPTSSAVGTGGLGDGTVGPRPANGMLPGRAVLETQTGVIRTFGPDGSPGETIQPDPGQRWSQPVRSDLAGGWVACGPTGALVWYPAGQAPVVLSDTTPVCTTETLQPLHVVDSADGATAVYESGSGPRAVVLETGDDRAVDVPALPEVEPGSWSAATGRLLVMHEGRYRLFDIDTGEEIAIATNDAVVGETFVLAPDAASMAVLTMDAVTVVDLASGAERHRVTFDPLVFPFLSYDGTTVAVPRIPEGGSYEDAEVVVVELATGARRTLDVYGAPL